MGKILAVLKEEMVDLRVRLKRSTEVVSRQVVGETILVPIRHKRGDLESIYTLNESAARAWELMDGEHSLDEICDLIAAEYAVERETAMQDLLEIVGQLVEMQAVDEVQP